MIVTILYKMKICKLIIYNFLFFTFKLDPVNKFNNFFSKMEVKINLGALITSATYKYWWFSCKIIIKLKNI